MNDALTNSILGYMEDKANRYAIALEGNWGSGKTRYCEHELRDALRERKYSSCKVSMYGVSTVDELYGRLAMAIVRLDVNETAGRLQKMLKGVATSLSGAGVSFGKALLKKYNITLEATPQMFTYLLGEGHLVILDDFERGRLTGETWAGLSGAINNLVEGQGCKVMIVTNDYKAIDAELREKTVWRCYRFDPEPEELARDIILPQVPKGPIGVGFDAADSIERAAAMAGCHNARAMLKARDLISMAFSSEVMADVSIDVENRKRAFTDLVRYALLAAMGKAPEKPLAQDPATSFDVNQELGRHSYNQYSQLGVIADYFDPKTIVGIADVNECLKTYVLAYYSGSPATMNLLRVLEKASDFQAMDDTGVEQAARELSHCLRLGGFDLSHLNDALQVNETLRRWGFGDALDEGEALEVAKAMVDSDIEQAYGKVYGTYRLWEDEWSSRYGYVDGLMQYIVEQYESYRQEQSALVVECSQEQAGKRVAEAIRESLQRENKGYLCYEPAFIAECFVYGDASTQYAIYDLSRLIKQRAVFCRDDESRAWLQKLHDELSSVEPASRMGKVRRRWTVDEMKKALRQFEQGQSRRA